MSDRVGQVLYFSFLDELLVVMDKTPAILVSGGTMWCCLSLETGAVRWLSDYDVDHICTRFA